MKNYKIAILVLLVIGMLTFDSCGPIIISSRPNNPPPSWFYPNRLETVRYVYFPDHLIYYDLSLRTYIYLDNGIWISANILPPRFNRLNLRRSRYIRVKNYFGDDIKRYHKENNNKSRSRSSSSNRRK